jgi:hypothetical protein
MWDKNPESIENGAKDTRTIGSLTDLHSWKKN